ncbi:hypothetical protein [Mesorhizobium sp. B2-8-9]|uniref:hypothetical protein n=1 Tax=Mesorhizobium sp. B2-8-9 TaxID=2589899 RepID=UPI0011288259|nr:hypothetical protein [Mesorhizobium sp. B2-8-9]TPI86424.1 hypothetical protein FJ423_00955 [Mesorhizobium sp. B2-8-9]
MTDKPKTLEDYLYDALPPSPEELLPSDIVATIRAAVKANPDLLDELEPGGDAPERTKDLLDNTFDQLRRYGGGPDRRVLALVRLLADLNDDIWHSRSTLILQEKIDEARKILADIEKAPDLA